MISNIKPCGTTRVLPTVYDNSLSYEEQINKILYYLHHYVVSDEELKETLNKINNISVINVSDTLGFGSLIKPISLTCLGLDDYTTLYFSRGTYFIEYEELTDYKHLTFLMPEATLIGVSDKLLDFTNCDNLTLYGGCVNGDLRLQYGIQIKNCKNANVENVTFEDFGDATKENVSGLNIFGDCSGFYVKCCNFDNMTAGVVSSDGFIHSYGILVNRLGSTQEYSSTGKIECCNFTNIASMDTTRKGDGDGIFIQAPPYNSNGEIVRPMCKVKITECYFENCKKRGIKVATIGSEITNCVMRGEFWFACIDLQYGNCTIKNCVLENKSDYNGSITSCLISSDGGFTVDGCYMTAPYTYVNPDTEETKDTYHPGVRFNSRLGASVIPDSEKWDDCWITNCYFDGVSRGVFAYDSNQNPPTYKAKGIHIINCRFGRFNQTHCVDISPTRFSEIDVFEMIDFKLDYGNNRAEVATKITDPKFTYPLGIGVPVTMCFNYYSNYWENEPMSGYDGLPNCVHGKIIYSGPDMGGISYKEWNPYSSLIIGNRNPNEITTTLAKQLLYNSKIGDRYICNADGKLYICSSAGTSSTVGTWTEK